MTLQALQAPRLHAPWTHAGRTRAPVAAVEVLWWTLRVGACLCFVGHGAFGILTKAGWVPYFAVAGIGRATAFHLMPWIGVVDIALGLLALVRPRPALLAYLVVWTVWTAALRPLAGEPVWETVERAGNYGVPLAALLLCAPVDAWRAGWHSAWRAAWLAPATVVGTPARLRRVRLALGLTTAALLVGHGLLALHGKPALVAHAGLLGGMLHVSVASATLARVLGGVDLALAALVLVRPTPGLALGVAGWKLATEMLYLAAGAPGWEVVERGGSYAAPIALALLLWRTRHRDGEAERIGADIVKGAQGSGAQ